jgi:flagellar biosynthesis/type III secretory pathway protein FliH
MIARGRRIPAAELGAAVSTLGDAPDIGAHASLPRGRRVPRAVLDGHAERAAILQRARKEAEALLDQARRDAAGEREAARRDGLADGAAALAARWLALEAREGASDALALERTTALARVLAERLLGAELALAPERVALLAQQALREARGARRARILAHPEDVAPITAALGNFGFEAGALEVRADLTRARGNLRLETELGVLDAELAPQLDRLLARLAGTLKGRP